MPSNKKPRHKQRVKRIVSVKTDAFMQKGLSEMFTKVGLIAELKLPRGACDVHDMSMLRTHLNLIGFILESRDYIDLEEKEEATKIHEQAVNAFISIYQRHKIGASSGFTPTGEELTAIREGIAYFDLPLRDALRIAPRHLERDFRAMEFYVRGLK